MDPLSDVLSLLKVESFLSARMQARGRWALQFPAYRHIKFGGLLRGSMWLWTEGDESPTKLEAGDFYLLTDGRPYCSATDPKLTPVDGRAILATHLHQDGIVRLGENGMDVECIGGRFAFHDATSDLLLRHLPPFVHVPGSSRGGLSLRPLLDLLRFETDLTRAGSRVAASSIANLVLLQILREHVVHLPLQPCWLKGLADPQIAAALKSMHGELARQWKVQDLAKTAGMSRTLFAERFKTLVGLPPIDYLSHWRTAVASNELRESNTSITRIAEKVGYTSHTAFSLAFKRNTGLSPGQFRLKNLSTKSQRVSR